MTIQNPSTHQGSAKLTYYVTGQATPRVRTVLLPPQSRVTVRVHEEQNLDNPGGLGQLGPGVGNSLMIEATIAGTNNPLAVVAERPMYFIYTSPFSD